MSHPTVQKYIQTAKLKGLTWDQIQGMSDADLKKVMSMVEPRPAEDQRPEPDCAYIHLTKFRQFYRKFAKKIRLSLRQVYKFGSTMFVDYAGQTVPIYDRVTGAVSQAQIFVAALGASNYAYAEATPDQSLASWIGSHVRTFEYFRGVTEKIICDNLKAGVTSPCRYEPDINLSYADLAVINNFYPRD